MKKQLFIKLVSVIFFLLLLSAFSGFGQVISFDEIPTTNPPLPVSVRYINQGFIFPYGAEIVSLPLGNTRGPLAKSGKNVLVSGNLSAEFDNNPLTIGITQAVQGVTLYTGIPKGRANDKYVLLLTAYDKNDKQVATSSLELKGQTDVTNEMSVTSPDNQHTITKVSLSISSLRGTFKFIDDLTVKVEGRWIPPKIAQEPPDVVITSPSVPSTTSELITISGTISGEGLYPEIAPPKLTVTFPPSPGSTLPSVEQELILGNNLRWNWNGTALAFSLEYKLTQFGTNTIKVEAYNPAGVGMDKKDIFYLSEKIANEYKGKEGIFGNLVQGGAEGACTHAIFQKGAIFQSGNSVYPVLGEIFAKWASPSLKSSTSKLGLLGCAAGPEKMIAIPAIGKSQDFEHGRIYFSAKGAFYVDGPFLDAIDKLNFVENYGFPVTDPVTQNKQLLPKKWQKFEIEKINPLNPYPAGGANKISFPATMEITDNPSELWIACPDFEGALRAGAPLMPRVPYLWRSFPCQSPNGPCSGFVKIEPGKHLDYEALRKACNYGHYPSCLYDKCKLIPQWSSLSPGKIVPCEGNIIKSYHADKDAPWNHDCNHLTFMGVDWGTFNGADWGIDLALDPQFEHLITGNEK